MRKTAVCINCYESINFPLCSDCFINQIEKWLKNSKYNASKTKDLIKKLKKSLHWDVLSEPEPGLICIKCNNEVHICPYCYFKKTIRILDQTDLKKETKDNFIHTFNYKQGL